MEFVANPGSALGEALGTLLEREIHSFFESFVKERGYIYVTSGLQNTTGDRTGKLILEDHAGNKYNIDAVIINRRFQPLVLIEAKYIRYKKHNRDKASWICTAHTRLRQRYSTVRQSIAILMGNWSRPSRRLLESFDVRLFEIPFEDICSVLLEFGIDYHWAETDREKAYQSWTQFSVLSDEQKKLIGERLIAKISDKLKRELSSVLDDSRPRRVKSLTITVQSTHGETRCLHFGDLKSAVEFLSSTPEPQLIDVSDAPSLLHE